MPPRCRSSARNSHWIADTNGSPVTCELEFNDGEESLVLGTVTTTERERVNLNVNGGLGFQAYKCSLLLTGSGIAPILLYQAKIRAIPLAETRQSLDSYWLKQGTAESKACRQLYLDYNSSAPITCTVYYDESALVAPFVFTLPQYNGVRKRHQAAPPRR